MLAMCCTQLFTKFLDRIRNIDLQISLFVTFSVNKNLLKQELTQIQDQHVYPVYIEMC